jgi:chromosome segregation ATPase
MLRLRRELNEINKLVTDCQLQVEESKRELRKCREMIDGLKTEQATVKAQIQQYEKEGNK